MRIPRLLTNEEIVKAKRSRYNIWAMSKGLIDYSVKLGGYRGAIKYN